MGWGNHRHAERRHFRRWPALRARLAGPARFSATVLASAVLSVVLQEAWPSAKTGLVTVIQTFAAGTRTWTARWGNSPVQSIPREAAFVPNRSVPSIEQYERYYSEAMPLLRGDASVTLVALEAPAATLRHQSNGRIAKRRAPYALEARGKTFPAFAVSRNAEPFLESMRLTFIDPARLPPTVLQDIAAPIPGDRFAERFLVVPDVGGANAKHFSFQRRR